MARSRTLTLGLMLLTMIVLPAAAEEAAETPQTTSSASPNLTVLRVESLDAALGDVTRLATLAGAEMEEGQVLDPLGQMIGVRDVSWVDRQRPLVAVLPSSAMMMGAQGIVAALPVTDTQSAINALDGMFARSTHGEDGVHQFFAEDDQMSILAMPRDGNYLVVGSARNLVTAFEPASALSITALPPGSVAIDVFLEPVAPMALMGLQSGRMMVQQQMQQQAEAETDEGGEGAPAPSPDPTTIQPMMDMYFDLFENMIHNTSRLQLSFGIGAEDLILHKRLVPKAGSTLEGLLAAQKGGLPQLASLIDPADSMAVFAGQISFTPAFLEAMRTFLDSYGKAMLGFAEAMEANEETRSLAASVRLGAGQAGQWLDCYRGDFAGSYQADAEGGFRATSVSGTRDADNCMAALKGLLDAVRSVPAAPDGKMLVDVTENALTYGGVSALRYRMNLPIPLESAGTDAAERMLSSWFGGGGMVTLMGLKDDLMIGASGPEAEADFRAVVDRVSANQRRGGITGARFEPLKVGPGFFIAFDLARLLDMVAELTPPEEGKSAGLRTFLDALPEQASTIVFGARLDTSSANIDVALPLGIIEAIGAVEAAEKAHAHEGPAIDPEHEHEHQR